MRRDGKPRFANELITDGMLPQQRGGMLRAGDLKALVSAGEEGRSADVVEDASYEEDVGFDRGRTGQRARELQGGESVEKDTCAMVEDGGLEVKGGCSKGFVTGRMRRNLGQDGRAEGVRACLGVVCHCLVHTTNVILRRYSLILILILGCDKTVEIAPSGNPVQNEAPPDATPNKLRTCNSRANHLLPNIRPLPRAGKHVPPSLNEMTDAQPAMRCRSA